MDTQIQDRSEIFTQSTSKCCDALIYVNGICSDCKEHAEIEVVPVIKTLPY